MEQAEQQVIQKFFLTFGQKSPARNGYHVVWALSEDHARRLAIQAYGRQWSRIYSKEDWEQNRSWEHYSAGQIGELM